MSAREIDTFGFAYSLRVMFDRAGFPRDSSPNGVIEDVADNKITHLVRIISSTNEWPDIFLNAYSTNSIVFLYTDTPKEFTNGFARPIVTAPDPKRVYEAINDCLNQIGIKTHWNANSVWLAPGEFEIYIPPKNN